MISDEKAIDLAREIEHIDIDVKKTIENASTAGYLGEDHFYCSVIQNSNFTYPVDRLFENPPKLKLDNFYFDIISKALDEEGIYISLAYCNPEMRVSPDFIDEVIDYDDYELDEDDLFYQRNYVLVTSQSRKMFNIYEEEGISGHKPTDDIGLIVKYENGEYFSYFAVRSTDLCMSSLQVFHLVEDLPKEHEFSLLNPLNKLLIEMIHECVVLKD
ncbi:MAG: hypothetical protein IJQ68_01610 [Methanobrevibacter sp.]|uniref:hypothetical protein n=1 Tax=Methanobrevibacter sp. TaxID=66852 RepID=UPI0025F0A1CE|nr:hypothetical protein [Methanobrevibacter sp.]MBR0270677.1 hypothetical protein [Methanobrevibacter sp.]